MEYLFDYVEPTILICDKEFQKEVDQVTCNFLKHKLIFGENAEDILFKTQNLENFIPPKFTRSPDELVACLLLTSGSTGKPKVVKVSHSMLINCLNGVQRSGVGSSDHLVFGTAGLRWVSHMFRILTSIFYGSSQLFTGKDPDPQNICKIIDELKPTMILAPNSFLQEIFGHYRKEFPKYDFSSLKHLFNGGETVLGSTNSKWGKEFSGVITSINGYGITEIGGPMATGDAGLEINPGYKVRIVGENGLNLGPEQCGIIQIKLRVPFLKYYKRPEDDIKSFTSDGWFVTGDYGKVAEDNRLHIYCRYKDILKCGDKLLIPNSIEEHINEHPLVNLGVIVEVEQKIIIFIKLESGADKRTAGSELEVFFRSFLDWGTVEKVVYIEKFEIISTGKTDRAELKRCYLEGKYD